jgi:hypothetical protein
MKPDLFALGRLLGHSHVRVTEIYGHLLPGHLDEARNVVTFQRAEVGTVSATASKSEAAPRRSEADSIRPALERRLNGDAHPDDAPVRYDIFKRL